MVVAQGPGIVDSGSCWRPGSREGALDSLVDFLYSGKPYGWFWTCPDEQMDRIRLTEKLSSKPLTMENIFDAIITEHARRNGKNGWGTKFPMRYAYTVPGLQAYPHNEKSQGGVRLAVGQVPDAGNVNDQPGISALQATRTHQHTDGMDSKMASSVMRSG